MTSAVAAPTRPSSASAKRALGASRRVAGVGVSGQLHYAIEPGTALSALAVAADNHLAGQ